MFLQDRFRAIFNGCCRPEAAGGRAAVGGADAALPVGHERQVKGSRMGALQIVTLWLAAGIAVWRWLKSRL